MISAACVVQVSLEGCTELAGGDSGGVVVNAAREAPGVDCIWGDMGLIALKVLDRRVGGPDTPTSRFFPRLLTSFCGNQPLHET